MSVANNDECKEEKVSFNELQGLKRCALEIINLDTTSIDYDPMTKRYDSLINEDIILLVSPNTILSLVLKNENKFEIIQPDQIYEIHKMFDEFDALDIPAQNQGQFQCYYSFPVSHDPKTEELKRINSRVKHIARVLKEELMLLAICYRWQCQSIQMIGREAPVERADLIGTAKGTTLDIPGQTPGLKLETGERFVEIVLFGEKMMPEVRDYNRPAPMPAWQIDRGESYEYFMDETTIFDCNKIS